MGERDRDDDRIWRAAFREGYRRRPKAGELDRYKYWHRVSRRDGFDAAGPWECWPTKLIPVLDQPLSNAKHVSLLPPVPEAAQAPAEPPPEPEPPQPESPGPDLLKNDLQENGRSIPEPAGNGRPRAKERAEAVVREQLANGPAAGECVKAAAAEAKVSERTLIAAAERLGVRSQRGRWWLPGA